MNIRALRYSLIKGTEGYSHKSTTGRIREIKLEGKNLKFHTGTFTASYHYGNEKHYQDDFKQWNLISQLQKES